ncbi:hypothetical protein GE115_17560 [Agromyces sp. CFH 90414]|uniref:DUF1801 domain-containing protein n=1 Tax=Agromyces agglutinans TaxID=2662258 RepID=A0A6I2FAM5_9MICO|nr:hypothetical protein [Agromyces agglutinans]MRG61669.1 hypothetical protein [Agromyces agglutinans]
MVTESPEAYLRNAPEIGRPWLTEFWSYVDERAPRLSPIMFRQVPMYRFFDSYQKGYVMFTAAKDHFATHAIDFDLIAQAQADIPGAKGGKGNVAVKYSNVDAKPALKVLIDTVLERHGFLGP